MSEGESCYGSMLFELSNYTLQLLKFLNVYHAAVDVVYRSQRLVTNLLIKNLTQEAAKLTRRISSTQT